MKIKRISIFIFLLSMIILLVGCGLKNASNSLEITKVDEKTILEYLDTKTNDIDKARVGKMYSAFSILGTDEDSIYIWLLKEEYFKQGKEIVQQGGVSLPVVLYVEKSKNGIEIKNHKYPGDGEQYGKDMKKLFPRNVIDEINSNYNERVEKLEKIIKSRAEEELIEKQTNKDEGNKLKVSAVKIDTVKTITNIHNELNNAVGYTNKPSIEIYKKAKIYGEQLKEAAGNETWDYIIFDLKRAALNLEYASKNNHKQSLVIAHRILHDLDVHVFNINDENSKKDFFGDSQTYRLMHNLPSSVPDELPPAGV